MLVRRPPFRRNGTRLFLLRVASPQLRDEKKRESVSGATREEWEEKDSESLPVDHRVELMQ